MGGGWGVGSGKVRRARGFAGERKVSLRQRFREGFYFMEMGPTTGSVEMNSKLLRHAFVAPIVAENGINLIDFGFKFSKKKKGREHLRKCLLMDSNIIIWY